MSHGDTRDAGLRRVLTAPAGAGVPPARPEFDEAYFTAISNYTGGRYDAYNPPHKIAGYLGEIRRVKPTGILLDVGCAFGRFLAAACAHYACEGLDISRYALGFARDALPRVRLHRAALETYASDRTYDVVTCFDVLEHVPDLDAALRSLRRLVAADGIVALAVPVYDSPPGWVFRIVDRDPTHVHKFSRWKWLTRLREAGLEPVVFKGILRVPLPGYFVHIISAWLRWSSSAIFVICRPTGGAGEIASPGLLWSRLGHSRRIGGVDPFRHAPP
ncbi:MAG: class I SAM-dependent methyltransferase [Armatimonadota bacterium]|nr:class I SAM-dependent methyltransferase [Armatimonadota bacterium]